MEQSNDMLMAVCRKKGSKQNIFIVFERGSKPDIPNDCEVFAYDSNKVIDWHHYKPNNGVLNSIKNLFKRDEAQEEIAVADTMSEEEKMEKTKQRNISGPLIKR
ncbi:hypothetical protein SAMN04487866_12210 [Thermoactinomyces sp. DSM 45891]|uniref:hypothetical protein n=1 Tax=Thermoactinomyces sp. DSM 45891 TaxID=1761907 RepID=UPI00091C115F|nr:hypothetical protein [Thermoactinomyces sp. DSM 45891]SFX74651.1 hypothetical protein SAMN04487866_12210 [Thermoactinomyces sp. DSM 45891]